MDSERKGGSLVWRVYNDFISDDLDLGPTEVLLRLLNVAVNLAKDLDKLVEARLREDWAGRKVEVR